MREPLRDKERLLHILESIDRILESEVKIEEVKEFSISYYGIVKLIEIIGEATYKLTKEFKETHPATPWAQIERMRHVLVHGYYTISLDFIQEVVIQDLPVLKQQISGYLKEFS